MPSRHSDFSNHEEAVNISFRSCIVLSVQSSCARVMKSTAFWDMTTCSPVEVHWHFRVMYCFHLQGWRVCQASKALFLAGCLAHSSNLKMEAVCSCKTVVNFCHILEDRTLHGHCCKILKSHCASPVLLCQENTLVLYWDHTRSHPIYSTRL
jgi:hypothetical protein